MIQKEGFEELYRINGVDYLDPDSGLGIYYYSIYNQRYFWKLTDRGHKDRAGRIVKRILYRFRCKRDSHLCFGIESFDHNSISLKRLCTNHNDTDIMLGMQNKNTKLTILV